MADLTITEAQVLPDATGTFIDGIAGATLTAGQAVYKDATTNTMKPADANASAATATVVGITTHAALAGQPVRLQRTGDLTLGAGAAPAVAKEYIVSGTAGGIAPISDQVTGWYYSRIGYGIAGNKIRLDIKASGQVTP